MECGALSWLMMSIDDPCMLTAHVLRIGHGHYPRPRVLAEHLIVRYVWIAMTVAWDWGDHG